MSNNVAGRRVNRCNGNVAGDFDRNRCDKDDVAGDFGRRRCEFVFECLEELLEDRNERRRNNDCEFVFECLEELLEEVLGENENHKCRCHRN